MDPKRGATQDKPADGDHREGDNDQPRHRPEIAVADPLKVDIGVDHRGAIGQQVGSATQRGIGAERDDKRRQTSPGNQNAVEQAHQQARTQRGGNGQCLKRRIQRGHHRHHRGGTEHRSHREIDTAGENDEGHARRQHNVDRRLARDVQQVGFGEEVRCDKAKYRHD